MRAIMLREPLPHVVSQHAMCLHSSWGKRTTSGSAFPRNASSVDASFEQWVDHFARRPCASRVYSNNYGCYHPHNMMSRALVSNRSTPHSIENGCEWDAMSDNGSVAVAAVAALDTIDVVLLLEHYSLSLCVLKAAIEKRSARTCTARATRHVTHRVHHNGTHAHLPATSSLAWEQASRLTQADRVLYAHARKRFFGYFH
jgi:hypothetical protein